MAANTLDSTWLTPHSRKFAESVDLLQQKFVNNLGIPLCLTCGTSRRFTATTATTLLALYHIGKLTDEMRRQFHETIFACKNNADSVSSGSQQGSTVAWDQQEGTSPWVTSLAIWSLLGTKYDGNRFPEIKAAVLWLLEQHQGDSGWGRFSDNVADLFSTSITLHALKLVSDVPNAIGLTNVEAETIKKIRKTSLEGIRRSARQQRDIIYWTGQTELGAQPDPTMTLCAIWTLQTSKNLDKNKMQEDIRLIEGGIRYLRKALREQAQVGQPATWPFQKVISSPPIAGPAWSIVSFTPSFVIPLLAMQCDPFEAICFAPIQWLQQNYLEDEHGWSHENYGHAENHALSFTTAYALWTIANWYKYAARHSVWQHAEIVKTRHQRNFILTLFIIASIIFLFNFIARFLPPIPVKILADWFSSTNNILQFLSALFGVLTPLYITFRFIDGKFFNKRLSHLFSKLMSNK